MLLSYWWYVFALVKGTVYPLYLQWSPLQSDHALPSYCHTSLFQIIIIDNIIVNRKRKVIHDRILTVMISGSKRELFNTLVLLVSYPFVFLSSIERGCTLNLFMIWLVFRDALKGKTCYVITYYLSTCWKTKYLLEYNVIKYVLKTCGDPYSSILAKSSQTLL